MNRIEDYLEGVQTVAIAAHVNPDGDAIGSSLGTASYLRDNYPELTVDVYLQKPRAEFFFLAGADRLKTEYHKGKAYDLLILVDISSIDRIGVAGDCISYAKNTLLFDHHLTNRDSFTWKYNDPKASSASEVVWRFLDPEKVSRECAEAIFLGIVHDTGVFQYSSTSPDTMRVAASLMEKGINANAIIDNTFYQKSWNHNRMLGKVLAESRLEREGKVIFGLATLDDMYRLQLHPRDMDGIVSQMRNTYGVEVACFMYEVKKHTFKVSLRSRAFVDVSRICMCFGGGGHARASGCTLEGEPEEIFAKILTEIDRQL